MHRLTVFTSFLTVLLLAAGALVTGTGSGLAVPDWPLSFGQFFPEMTGGVLFEHGHRLVAGTVATVVTIQAFVIQRFETRSWVRKLGWLAVALVLFQAFLGGMTVLFRLPTAVSIAHACLAQLFFSTTVILAVVTSKTWRSPRNYFIPPIQETLLPWSMLCLSMLFFLQLLMGATMRHTGAGLAIPDFPTAFGGIIPPEFDYRIAIHFAHRMGAFVLMGFTALVVARTLTQFSQVTPVILNAGILATFLSIQFMLGAMIIWFRKPVQLTTVHLVLGALSLATSIALTVQSFKFLPLRRKARSQQETVFA